MAGSLFTWFKSRLSGFAVTIPDKEMVVVITPAPTLRSNIPGPTTLMRAEISKAPTLRTRVTK